MDTQALVPSASTLGLFCLAALAVLATPGPAVIYVITRSIGQGRKAGFASSVGIATGDAVYVAAAAVGISALLASSALAFDVVRYAGAGYLVYLGIRKLTARSRDEVGDGAPSERLRGIYARGMLVNVLNPKTALFLFSFLPQFVNAGRGGVALQIMILGLVYIALGLLSDGTYVLVASSLRPWLRSRPMFLRRHEQVSGVVYVGLGLAAAASGSRGHSG